jgi:hypothetical protein
MWEQSNGCEICMLVRFDSDVGTLTMFDEVAVQLLKSMGHSGAVPSAILPEDIPAAVERLKAAAATQPDAAAGARAQPAGDQENELPVSLKQRAFPLIELLDRAAKQKCEVLWR